MNIELVSMDDLQSFKKEILAEISTLLEGKTEPKKWLRSSDVKEMLNISDGTLQTLRVNGTLPYTKMGKTMYYEYSDVTKILTENKKSA
ncbi:helix-turn-helix domain-containing protein [uncultured Lutibacter sp.]|uniref:helix-turn-helix domain-containing protein n=1 Tax=uncultured Lutibacter sp. TaxID=437739 RepID=UPI002608A5AC|nr:helix-turn-helix domain-containing protein [uncultured Lutibacter sp.]